MDTGEPRLDERRDKQSQRQLTTGPSQWLERLISDARFQYLLLFLIQLKVIWRQWDFRDLQDWDDAGYLAGGQMLLQGKVPDVEFAPLYKAWYAALAIFTRLSPAELFFLQKALTILLVTLIMYAVLRTKFAGLWPGLVVMSFWAFMGINLDAQHGVSHFALLLALIGLLLSCRVRSSLAAYNALFTFLLLAYLVRPDFQFAVIVLGMCGAATAIRWWLKSSGFELGKADRIRQIGQAVPQFGSSIIVLAIILIWTANIPKSMSGGRLWFNFAQNYSHVANTDPSLNEWSDWELVFRRTFPKSNSISEAIIENPRAVAGFVAANLITVPPRMATLMFGHVNVILPAGRRTTLAEAGLFAFAVGICALIAVRRKPFHFRDILSRRWSMLNIGIISIASAAVPSWILANSRDEFLLPLMPAWLLLLCYVVSRIFKPAVFSTTAKGTYLKLCFVIILAILVPYRYGGAYQSASSLYDANRPEVRANWAAVKLLTKALAVQQNGNIRLLSQTEESLCAYVGTSSCRGLGLYIAEDAPNGSLVHSIEKERINVILVNRQLEESRQVKADQQFQKFIRQPDETWLAVPIQGTNDRLLFRTQAWTQSALSALGQR